VTEQGALEAKQQQMEEQLELLQGKSSVALGSGARIKAKLASSSTDVGIGIGVSAVSHLIFVVVAAAFYRQARKHAYPKYPQPDMHPFEFQEFEYGLISFENCGGDWKLFLCSCCCGCIRWADTASSPVLQFMTFWPALLCFECFSVSGLGCCSLALAIANRQNIRRVYGMESNTFNSCCSDCLAWTFCSCHAIVQEARQVELIEPNRRAQTPKFAMYGPRPPPSDMRRPLPSSGNESQGYRNMPQGGRPSYRGASGTGVGSGPFQEHGRGGYPSPPPSYREQKIV